MACKFQIALPFNNKDQAGLVRTLNSLQKSVEKDFSILLINDSAAEVKIPSGHSNLRITVIDLQFNYGISIALKRAEKYFESDYIARLDCGDEIHPERFAKQLHCLNAHPEYGLVGVRTDLFVQNNMTRSFMRTTKSPSRIQNLSKYLLCSNPFSHGAIMFRTSSFFLAGGYNEKVKIAQDLDLYFRISQRASLFIIDEILNKHTFHRNGTTLSNNRKSVISGIKIRLKYMRFRKLTYFGFWLGLVRDLIFLLIPVRLLAILRTRNVQYL
jgi:glycosyltransferase involved in cell wall biosynthesis